MVDFGFIAFAIIVLCTVAWPVLTYAGDALRYAWYRLKGVDSE